MDAWALANPAVRVVVQQGTAGDTAVAESAPVIPHGQLCALFADAAVVVTHGGPSTVMDARSAGRLPIVVPRDPALGEHVDGHQLEFADHLGEQGLAVVARNVADLDAALRDAIDNPGRFAVRRRLTDAPGIAAFGCALDELLGTATPVRDGVTLVDLDRSSS
jgi:UDP-N-acetylglucosamine transferase subunit ALG13